MIWQIVMPALQVYQARLPNLLPVAVTVLVIRQTTSSPRPVCTRQALRFDGQRWNVCAATPGCCSRQREWQRHAQVLGGSAARGDTPRPHSMLQLRRRLLAGDARRRAGHAAAQRALHGAGRPAPCFARHCLNNALQPLQCLIQPRPAAPARRGCLSHRSPARGVGRQRSGPAAHRKVDILATAVTTRPCSAAGTGDSAGASAGALSPSDATGESAAADAGPHACRQAARSLLTVAGTEARRSATQCAAAATCAQLRSSVEIWRGRLWHRQLRAAPHLQLQTTQLIDCRLRVRRGQHFYVVHLRWPAPAQVHRQPCRDLHCMERKPTLLKPRRAGAPPGGHPAGRKQQIGAPVLYTMARESATTEPPDQVLAKQRLGVPSFGLRHANVALCCSTSDLISSKVSVMRPAQHLARACRCCWKALRTRYSSFARSAAQLSMTAPMLTAV